MTPEHRDILHREVMALLVLEGNIVATRHQLERVLALDGDPRYADSVWLASSR